MHPVVRSVWTEPRPAVPPPLSWRDVALVGVLGALVVVEVVLREDLPLPALSAAVTSAVLLTLLWRRSRPLLMLLLAFASTAVVSLVTGGLAPGHYTMAAMLLLPYAVVRWGSGREVVLGLAVTAVGVFSGTREVEDVVAGAVILLAVVALATATRTRASAAARVLEEIRLREREGLARDLHDVVAHHVSAIAVRAQAGIAVAEHRPEAAVEALRVIETEASRALSDMRSMVRVLRDDDRADLRPSPTIADLRDLADPGAAPPVAVHVDLGDESSGRALPPALQTSVYRLAQEAVTNARRHARDATGIDVSVRVDDRAVHLRVHDDGGPSGPAGPGFGLRGMSERAALLGGTCAAGPDETGGWTVVATLPRGAR